MSTVFLPMMLILFIILTLLNNFIPVSAKDLLNDGTEQKVNLALTAAAHKSYWLLYDLYKDPDRSLPYLERHISGMDIESKQGVVIVAKAAHSFEAIKVLVMIMDDQDYDTAERAVTVLYLNYDCAFLNEYPDKDLSAKLMAYLKFNRGSPKACLLLSCFDHDPEVIPFLTELKKKMINKQAKLDRFESLFSADVFVEVALAALHQPDAIQKVDAYINGEPVGNLVFLLKVDRFILDRHLLSDMVELLDDKRSTHPGSIYGSRNYYPRICDLALSQLALKSGLDVGAKPINPNSSNFRPYTDKELDKAYHILKNYYAGN